jgi:heptosyltransferase-1
MPEPRFLVLRLSSLGDIVHTFPAVSGLRKSLPGAEIVWLTSERWRLLVERSELASSIRTVDSRSWNSVRDAIRGIRRENWEAAIDFQGLWKTALLAYFGGVKRRIGFDSSTIREFGVPVLYSERVQVRTAHIADQNGELSLRAGARNGVAPFTLRVAAEEEKDWKEEMGRYGLDRYCVLCPGGGWRSKCWPAERFGALCLRLHEDLGMRCIVNYGPGEDLLAESVRAASGGATPVLDCSPLGRLLAMLRSAALAVGGDTGPLHLAVALGTPAVALFGPTDPARNGPYPDANIVLRSPNARRDHTRRDSPDLSMLEISVDSVFDAVQRRLEAAR